MAGYGYRWLSFLAMAWANLFRFRLRSLVVLLCLLAAVVPLLAALALHQGLKGQALSMLEVGPDLLVTGEDFGRPAAVPLEWIETVNRMPGVVRAAPRVVGRVMIEEMPALLVAIGTAAGDGGAGEGGPGALPQPGQGELAMGSALAAHFGISGGDDLQIALPVEGPERFRYRTFTVIDLLEGQQNPVWGAGLVLGDFSDLQEIFGQQGMASELLVWCRAGHHERIARELSLALGPAAKIQHREMMERYFHAGFDRRGGAFLVYYLAVLVISVPVLVISSGVGLSTRRREVAVLKSIGWETHELLLLQMMESLLVAVAGASLAVLLALAWLKLGSAWPLQLFLMPGAGELPRFRIPYELCWTPLLITYLFSISVTTSGALLAAWRAAAADPGELLLGGRD